MEFGVWTMLIGLAGIAIPPIIHLLNRRRYDVIDWGAMQFLKIGEMTRRRMMFEELLLMLLRMGLIAVLVLALAAPLLTEPVLNWWGSLTGSTPGQNLDKRSRPTYDFVLVFDGSASMTYSPVKGGDSLHEAAKKWAMEFVNDLIPGDRVAILRAGQQVLRIQSELSLDLERIRDKIAELPAPGGGINWPAAVDEAIGILAREKKPHRVIILLGDGQRHGWADSATRDNWTLLRGKYVSKKPEQNKKIPPIYYVDLDDKRADDEVPANWALGPLEVTRPVVPMGKEVLFRGKLELYGQKEDYRPPVHLRLKIDGKDAGELKAPEKAPPLDKGRLTLPFEFRHTFTAAKYRAGSHLVTVELEADPPLEKQSKEYVVRDQVPGDNRRDFSIEVVETIPVLIVEGDPEPKPKRGAAFLQIALTPKREKPDQAVSVVDAHIVNLSEFKASHLSGARPAVEPKPDDPRQPDKPRVLILSNVDRLSLDQQKAIDGFLGEGGGVLVTLGDRVLPGPYNEELYKGGRGWLPTRLIAIEGEEADLTKALKPGPSTHPALAIPLSLPGADLADAHFPRFWKLARPEKGDTGVVVATLKDATNAEVPFLVEKPYRNGRVLLCSVPLDNSWNTNLVTELQSFPPLAHELVYYLARARSAEYNLAAGQPLRYRLDSNVPLTGFSLQAPGTDARPLIEGQGDGKTNFPARIEPQSLGALLLFEQTRETGVYRLGTPEKQTVYFVVQPDDKESDPTPCNTQDREDVTGLIGVKYENDRNKMIATAPPGEQRLEVWWWFLLGLILLLCVEVWMTCRMVKNRV